MVRSFAVASVATFLALVLVNCFPPFYRYQTQACKQREAARVARVDKLKRDAHEHLGIGVQRDAVVRFFAEQGFPLTFVGNDVTGTINTTGCAPAACGSDNALIGLRVELDSAGAVTSEPVVVSLYTDCL
jgi:hypothetical protein